MPLWRVMKEREKGTKLNLRNGRHSLVNPIWLIGERRSGDVCRWRAAQRYAIAPCRPHTTLGSTPVERGPQNTTLGSKRPKNNTLGSTPVNKGRKNTSLATTPVENGPKTVHQGKAYSNRVQNVGSFREAIPREKCSFFEHCSKGHVVNFSEGILTNVRKRLSRQLSIK